MKFLRSMSVFHLEPISIWAGPISSTPEVNGGVATALHGAGLELSFSPSLLPEVPHLQERPGSLIPSFPPFASAFRQLLFLSFRVWS